MRTRVETNIVSTPPVVLLIAKPCSITNHLVRAISALHLQVELIDPSKNSQPETVSDKSLLFAAIWLDFQNNNGKREGEQVALKILEKCIHIPSLYVTFDLELSNSIVTSWSTARQTYLTIKKTLPNVQRVCYQHVVSDDVILSSVEEEIISTVISGKNRYKDFRWNPVLAQDCALHIAELLLRIHSCEGTYEGVQSIEFSESVSVVAKKIGREVVVHSEATFPHSFSEAFPIPNRDTTEWEEVIASVVANRLQESTQPQSQPKKKTLNQETQTALFVEKERSTAIKKRWSKQQKAMFSFGGVIVSAFFAYSVTLLVFLSTFKEVKSLVSTLSSTTTDSLSTISVTQANRQISRLLFIEKNIPIPYELLGFSLGGDGIHSSLQTLTTITEGVENYQKTQSYLSELYIKVTQESAGEVKNLSLISSMFDDTYRSFSQSQARLSQSGTAISALFGIEQKSMRQYISQVRDMILAQKTIVSALPVMLGLEKATTYAVVLEDATNIRSSGGHIETIGIMTFDKGKLFAFEVHPVSELDDLLKGTVEPPADLSLFLHTPSWKLADANWSPESSIAARQVAWFVSKQLQKEVDGVLFVPTTTLPQLLSVTGPIAIPSGEVLSQENVISTLRSWSANQREEKTNWKDLLQGIIQKTTSLSQTKQKELGSVISQAFQSQSLSLYHKDPEVQKSLVALGWDGGVKTPQCPSSFGTTDCLIHTVYQVENNIGLNPIGEFIHETITHTVGFLPGMIRHSHQIRFSNTATKDEWPQGNYRTLVKLIVEDTAVLDSVTIDGKKVEDSRVTVSKEFGKVVIALPVEVGRSAPVIVSINYSSTATLEKGSAYLLFVQKQIGKPETPLTVTFDYDSSFVPKTIAPAGESFTDQTVFHSSLSENRIFGVGF